MAGMESKQPVSTTCSVTAARQTLSTIPLATARERPKCRFSTTRTGNSSSGDNSSSWTGTYRRSSGPRPTTGHLEETVRVFSWRL